MGFCPYLIFYTYVDELLTRLSMSGFGFMIGHKYYSGIGYVDDIYLIVPSIY